MKPAPLRGQPRVIAAAFDSYRERGLHGLSLRDVAIRAGITAPAIYRHYPNREALVRDIVRAGFETFGRYLSRGLQGKTPEARLRRMHQAYFDFAMENPRDYETIFLTAEIPAMKRFPDDFARRKPVTFQLVADRVAECMAAGVMKKAAATEVALSLWAHVHGLIALYITGYFGHDPKAFHRIYQRSVERLLDRFGLRPAARHG